MVPSPIYPKDRERPSSLNWFEDIQSSTALLPVFKPSYLVIRKITRETFQSLPHLTVQDTPTPPFSRCISVPTPSLNHTEMNTLTEELFPSYIFF